MYRLEIDKRLCKGCGVCIAFCPVGVFGKEISGIPVPKNVRKCIGCNLCVLRCPDFAIKLEVEK